MGRDPRTGMNEADGVDGREVAKVSQKIPKGGPKRLEFRWGKRRMG